MNQSRNIEVLPHVKQSLGEGSESRADVEILERVDGQVKNRKQVTDKLREASKKSPGILKRAWNFIPGWVKLIGGAMLAAWLLSLLYGNMADRHKEIAEAAHSARKAFTNSLKALAPNIGLKQAGGSFGSGGDGFSDKRYMDGYEGMR